MDANYNFILTELLWYSEDKEFIAGFIEEFVSKEITLQVDYLTEDSFAPPPYSDIKKLLDQTLEASNLKLESIKAQDFEGAASYRDKERELLRLIDECGFNLYYLDKGYFALYHVIADKKWRKLTFTVYTNSQNCIDFIERIRERVNKGKSNKK
jgi:hypothetical protein